MKNKNLKEYSSRESSIDPFVPLLTKWFSIIMILHSMVFLIGNKTEDAITDIIESRLFTDYDITVLMANR